MLFERLQYMVEQNRRTADVDLDPDQRELQLELIAKIKQLYPQKLALLKAQHNFSRCQAEGTYTTPPVASEASSQAGNSHNTNSEKDQNSSFTEESKPLSGHEDDWYKRINKLVYGRQGLIRFMQRLFYGISPLDRKQFNYYFALKKQMAFLDHFPTDDSPLKNLG